MCRIHRPLLTLTLTCVCIPLFAVYKLEPFEGPMTGQTEVQIHGEDFSNGNIKVTFTDGKNTENVSGKYHTPTKLTCKSPDWLKVHILHTFSKGLSMMLPRH